MRHLFENWSRVGDRLTTAPIIALFLDFDGTLAPLQPTPEQVSLDGSMRQALAALVRSDRFRIWVISGRRRADVRARVRIPGIHYLGLHGWEGRTGVALAGETGRWLSVVLSRLETGLAGTPGIWIEDKVHALAVHYRGVEEADADRAGLIVDRIVAPFAEQFRVENGKKVWEVLPRELEDKGAAVRRQLSCLPGGAVAVYVGDDQVDEPAFAALPFGITVRVGGGCRSQAQYYLSGVTQVRAFLCRLGTEFA